MSKMANDETAPSIYDVKRAHQQKCINSKGAVTLGIFFIQLVSQSVLLRRKLQQKLLSATYRDSNLSCNFVFVTASVEENRT